MKFKEGGGVQSYEDGGSISRPSEQKLEDMVDSLTDEQLQQIIQNPTSVSAYRAAQEEMALRASMDRGIAGAANGGLMDRMMPTEESMARGGVVAFANGGNEGERTSMAGDLLRSITEPISSGLRATAEYAKLKEARDQARPGFFEQLTKGEKEARITQAKELSNRMKQVGGSSESKPANKAADPYDPATATRREDFKNDSQNKTNVEEAPKNKNIVAAATRIAEQQGVPKEDFELIMDRMMKKFKGANDKDLQGIKDYITKSGKDSEEIKKGAFNKAITEFGFNLAAQASKPGQGGGLRGLLASGAAAAPALSASVAESQKLMRAADENARKMQIEFTKYKVALDKGDQQLAISTASNLRQLQQADRQYQVELAKLEEQKRYHNMVGQKYAAAGEGAALKRAQLGLQARKQGETRAMTEFKDPIRAMEYKNKGVTPDMLAKKYAREAQGELLSSMITGLTPEED
jgi:hypothetical protein